MSIIQKNGAERSAIVINLPKSRHAMLAFARIDIAGAFEVAAAFPHFRTWIAALPY